MDQTGVTTGTAAEVDAAASELAGTNLVLPFSGSANSLGTAFQVQQGGGGRAGQFQIVNPGSPANALFAGSSGEGSTFHALNFGRGGAATFINNGSANRSPTVTVNSGSTGAPGFASALHVRALSAISGQPAVIIEANGTNTAFTINHKGASGGFLTLQDAGVNQARISRTGKGFFNGGTQTGGADLAEAFEVEGRVSDYQPGDVLVISGKSDRKMEKSSRPYSTRVAGVYATKPGVLLAERDIDESFEDLVPVGVLGILPTKVSSENGPIRRGDLLVTARTPGHAMLGDRDQLHFGMVLGKALENFSGPGRKTIRVLVNVK
jgi:hypothetical protein